MMAALWIECSVKRIENRQIACVEQAVDDTGQRDQFKDAAKNEKWYGKNFKIQKRNDDGNA